MSRDGLGVVVAMMERIIMEYMFRLKDTVRLQLLWLTREMVKAGVSSVDQVIFALLKQLPGTYMYPITRNFFVTMESCACLYLLIKLYVH